MTRQKPPSVSDMLLERLRDRGIVPKYVRADMKSLWTTSAARQPGGLVWTVTWEEGGLTFIAGSTAGMGACLKAPNLLTAPGDDGIIRVRPSGPEPDDTVPAWVRDAAKMYAQGQSGEEIGAQMGKAGSTVLAALRGVGVTIRPKGVHPRAVPRQRLITPPRPHKAGPPEWLLEAKGLYESGLNSIEVGKRVGHSAGTVLSEFRRHGIPVRRSGHPAKALAELPVVHLMITDPDHPAYRGPVSDVFAECCGLNWTVLAARGLVTSRPELVTCPGRGRAGTSPPAKYFNGTQVTEPAVLHLAHVRWAGGEEFGLYRHREDANAHLARVTGPEVLLSEVISLAALSSEED